MKYILCSPFFVILDNPKNKRYILFFFQYVLNVTKDLPNVFEASGGIQYLKIPITDHYSQDLAMHFPSAIQFIGMCVYRYHLAFE